MPIDVITSSGTWLRPPGVDAQTFKGGGAPGGGGGQNGGGGGGGGYDQTNFTGLTAPSYSVTIGDAGTQGVDDNDGGNGGDTYWDDGSVCKAFGGGGGLCGINGGTGGTGGAGLSGSGHKGGDGGNAGGGAGGGGGGGAAATGDGGNGSDGSGGVGGAGGAGGAGTGGANGGSGGDDDSDGGNATGSTAGQFSIGAPGGGGNDTSMDGVQGGLSLFGGIANAVWSNPSLDVPTQPTNTNSGSTIPTFTARIKTAGGSPDTNASTAGRGNTCSLTLTTGPGSITAGTTTRAYGSGADGSKANFDDIVITGSTGTYQFTITDDTTGVTVATGTFTITGGTTNDLAAIASSFTAARTAGAGHFISSVAGARGFSASFERPGALGSPAAAARSFPSDRDSIGPAKSNVTANAKDLGSERSSSLVSSKSSGIVSDRSAARELSRLTIPPTVVYANSHPSPRSEWTVLLATPLIQSAHANERVTDRDRAALGSKAAFDGSEESVGQEHGPTQAIVPARGRDEPRLRDAGLSRGALLANAISEPRARDRSGPATSIAAEHCLDESASRDRSVFIAQSLILASDQPADRSSANELTVSELFGRNFSNAEDAAGALSNSQAIGADRTQEELSAVASIDAQAHALTEPRELIRLVPAAASSMSAVDQTTIRDFSSAVSIVGALSEDDSVARSKCSLIIVAEAASLDSSAEFSSANEHVTASIAAGRDQAASETWLVNIWATGINYDNVKSWEFCAFAGAIPHAAFESSVHVAFGCLADKTNTKGHTSIGGETI